MASGKSDTTNEAIASRLSCELDAMLPINPDSERKRIIYDQVVAVLNVALPKTTKLPAKVFWFLTGICIGALLEFLGTGGIHVG